MKRALILFCIAGSIFAVAMLISPRWPSRRSASPPQAKPVLILPAGTSVPIRLVGIISEDSKAGDTLQGVVADSIFLSSRIAIPVSTRALVKLVRIQPRKDEVADVSVELKELISRDGKVPVHSGSVTTSLKVTSDVDLIARGIAGLIGSAVGAAGSASLGRSPDVGAARLGNRLSTGATRQDTQEIVFKTAEPIDLTTVTW
jgi:hypothetical protein